MAESHKSRRITIDGISFVVDSRGRKLRRVDLENPKPTPARCLISGIAFQRSIKGHLWRLGLQKAANMRKMPCRYFSLSGECIKRDRCPYMHDSSKKAICLNFLANSCQGGASCALSHDPSPERMPDCHREHDEGSDCLYRHPRLKEGAALCRNFSKFGYCKCAENCPYRHDNKAVEEEDSSEDLSEFVDESDDTEDDYDEGALGEAEFIRL